MKPWSRLILGLILLINAGQLALAAEGLIRHELTVVVKPELAWLEATDTISLPAPVNRLTFELHAGLSLELNQPDARLIRHRQQPGPVPVSRYTIVFSQPRNSFTLHYQGRIKHPIQPQAEGYSGGRSGTVGLIAPEGVFLNRTSYWFPVIDDSHLLRFSLRVNLPAGWSSISQGEPMTDAAGWHESSPQDDIYLIAGPLIRYQKPTASGQAQVLAQVFLRKPDPALAARYLEATENYLTLYQSLLGPYPYQKFALVENFWETGFGMPSFTLLGPRVIRLPFILHSSYPHEILHNWWGNGVFVDADSGNWSEGLTSYLADHLIKEQHGQGAGYRRGTLQAYADYVSQTEDFPLVQFRGNHGQASQAVGYGKTLMLFHMLRRKLGDARFLDGLRLFYRNNLFQEAGFAELRAAFEAVSDSDLKAFFKQWTTRTGAPALKLIQARVNSVNDMHQLELTLRQVQDAPPFEFDLSVFIQVEGEQQARLHRIKMNAREHRLRLSLDKRPLRVSVDPRFETFRQLDPSEIPSSLGQLFGADRLILILPGSADKPTRQAYLSLAKKWAGQQPGLQIKWDQELDRLPPNTAAWIIGQENRFAPLFAELTRQATYRPKGQSIALTRQHPTNPTLTLGLLSADAIQAIPGLARKLPHYGRYGYVTFTGKTPDNRLKGAWSLEDSALSRLLDHQAGIPPMAIPALEPLTSD